MFNLIILSVWVQLAGIGATSGGRRFAAFVVLPYRGEIDALRCFVVEDDGANEGSKDRSSRTHSSRGCPGRCTEDGGSRNNYFCCSTSSLLRFPTLDRLPDQSDSADVLSLGLLRCLHDSQRACLSRGTLCEGPTHGFEFVGCGCQLVYRGLRQTDDEVTLGNIAGIRSNWGWDCYVGGFVFRAVILLSVFWLTRRKYLVTYVSLTGVVIVPMSGRSKLEAM